MKMKIPSRNDKIDVLECLNNFDGSRHEMILVAARRTREMLATRRRTEQDPYVTPIDALMEIQAGKINPLDYINRLSPEEKRKYYASRFNEGWTL
jgi:DNA-directed RNA polymerase omega subunit